ncbi:hypothetical protein Nepgr_020384 [Nepenthes gracilis]|uniref:Secreted protein n=1 Tax=Nepenthes gracilis TaxID=150966 RepID=A0AAD3SUZ2_NEPGR|nr:hypothetical protein Nepgr_020384 [Nepenthes gracilis]
MVNSNANWVQLLLLRWGLAPACCCGNSDVEGCWSGVRPLFEVVAATCAGGAICWCAMDCCRAAYRWLGLTLRMDVECHPHTAAVMHQYPDGRGAARWMLNFGLMEVHYDSDANALVYHYTT